jgi:hypothetical protein
MTDTTPNERVIRWLGDLGRSLAADDPATARALFDDACSPVLAIRVQSSARYRARVAEGRLRRSEQPEPLSSDTASNHETLIGDVLLATIGGSVAACSGFDNRSLQRLLSFFETASCTSATESPQRFVGPRREATPN